MLSKTEKNQYRSELFRYLDGLGTMPSAYVLYKRGVLSYLLEQKKASASALAEKFEANEGYLNVALRVLASQGWLIQHVDNANNLVIYEINELSPTAFAYFPLYKGAFDLLVLSGKYHARVFQKEPFLAWQKVAHAYLDLLQDKTARTTTEGVIRHQILKHIEGTLVAPTIVALGMSGMFHKYFMEHSFQAEEFHKDAESFEKLLDFFVQLEWFKKQRGTYTFTDKGLFFAKRASAFGVTVSYNPTFRHLEELIFGDPNVLRQSDTDKEQHVDREMNVWGSGGAHGTYFKKIDEIIIQLFNKPIEEQPKGIVDMGCGNGAYLQHLYEVIEQRTRRGQMLDEYPLFLVGADYNKVALKVTRANLIKADIWAKVIWGDIGRPDLLASDLEEMYGIALEDLLNVRTFLDHNRIWEAPKNASMSQVSTSSGAFAYRGKRLDNNVVEASLKEHFQKWLPYVKKFGLLLIELHTVAPALVARNIGKGAATAYDATHGYSDQYILEVGAFKRVAEEAGLISDKLYFHRFPNSELATVSINLLKGAS